MHTKFWSENLKGKDHSEDRAVDGRILEWIWLKQVGTMRTGFSWLKIGT